MAGVTVPARRRAAKAFEKGRGRIPGAVPRVSDGCFQHGASTFAGITGREAVAGEAALRDRNHLDRPSLTITPGERAPEGPRRPLTSSFIQRGRSVQPDGRCS
ncbi:hypothetical protein TNCT1_35580 [Streptomyces sp. 1-11]|nr:hypothetical protein TNCT1_35580 [Streptomyces sp. 1-11]